MSLSIILVSTGHSWNHRRLAEFRLMSSFSFHARYALLTYAQCGDLCPFTIVDLLSTMGAECIIGREHHQDGGIHLHVFVDFGRKYRSRRADTFDVEVSTQTLASLMALGEGLRLRMQRWGCCCGGLDRPVPTEGRGGDSKTHSIWSQITSATTRESFWDLVHDLDPKSAVTCFTQLQKYCDWKYRYCPPAYESL